MFLVNNPRVNKQIIISWALDDKEKIKTPLLFPPSYFQEIYKHDYSLYVIFLYADVSILFIMEEYEI